VTDPDDLKTDPAGDRADVATRLALVGPNGDVMRARRASVRRDR